MMQQHTTNNSEWDGAEEEKGVDVRKLMNKAISLWPWMLICAMVMGSVAFIYLYFSTPDYKVNAKILIKDDEAAQVREAVPMSMRDIFDPTGAL